MKAKMTITLALGLMSALPGQAQAWPGHRPGVVLSRGRPAPRPFPAPRPVPGRVVVQPGRGYYGRDGRIVIVGPRRPGDAIERHTADMIFRHSQDLRCENLGELIRRISNEVLEASQKMPEEPSEYDSRDEWERKQIKRVTHILLSRPEFVQKLMERLTDAFKGCNRTCFDSGVEIGVISGTGYCNASIGVGGLSDDGFKYQGALPLCQTETFVGCQQGYTQAVNTVQGCLAYATGSFTAIYDHSVSQDCHIDP